MDNDAQKELILDKALELAKTGSWEGVRLSDVARELGISLDAVHRHYRQKDDLAEALFDRADRAMLAAAALPDFQASAGRERLHRVIMAWLHALSEHKAALRQILGYKLEPGHIHLQVLGLLRTSRTVQWFLEAAGSRTAHLSRIAEEVGATSVFLTTFVYWLTDTSEDSSRTDTFLDGLLARSERLAGWVNPASVVARSPG